MKEEEEEEGQPQQSGEKASRGGEGWGGERERQVSIRIQDTPEQILSSSHPEGKQQKPASRSDEA